VRWYIDDSPYANLPHFIEEGLADWIACDLTGGLKHRIAESVQIGTLSIYPHISHSTRMRSCSSRTTLPLTSRARASTSSVDWGWTKSAS
jgi:hypothetical protein